MEKVISLGEIQEMSKIMPFPGRWPVEWRSLATLRDSQFRFKMPKAFSLLFTPTKYLSCYVQRPCRHPGLLFLVLLVLRLPVTREEAGCRR